MSISLYSITIPVFVRMLGNLRKFLDKAEAHAAERGTDRDGLFALSLAPDMLPLGFQIQVATDAAKGAAARLSGSPLPSWPDDEKTFAEFQARIDKAIHYLGTFEPAAFAGPDDRTVSVRIAGKDVSVPAEDYVLNRAIPNFYFHVTTAYGILRNQGVPLGKSDFLA